VGIIQNEFLENLKQVGLAEQVISKHFASRKLPFGAFWVWNTHFQRQNRLQGLRQPSGFSEKLPVFIVTSRG